jgi:hypothetical protein
MIRDWSKFNESKEGISSSDFSKSFIENINYIRSFFLEFEDANRIIDYSIWVSGNNFKERKILDKINPKVVGKEKFDLWSKLVSERSYPYLDGGYRKMFLDADLLENPFYLNISIDLPEEANGMVGDRGVDVLEDILVSYKRLKESYNDTYFNFIKSSNIDDHSIKLRCYFNPLNI